MLEDKREIHMQYAIHECNIFMQDGAPCYRSKLVSDFLEKKKNIKALYWAGNSPDLNPMRIDSMANTERQSGR